MSKLNSIEEDIIIIIIIIYISLGLDSHRPTHTLLSLNQIYYCAAS